MNFISNIFPDLDSIVNVPLFIGGGRKPSAPSKVEQVRHQTLFRGQYTTETTITRSLEMALRTEALAELNITHDCGFRDYLEPNEYYPEKVQEHLDLMKKGLIVSTGTERSLFDLILGDERRCEGLVVRDINHKVAAFINFTVLLLRISESHAIYNQLALLGEEDNGREKLEVIRSKLETSKIPQPMKNYYRTNLDSFAEVYYRYKTRLDTPFFYKVNYHLHVEMFEKLQRYAKAGKIIATIGNINDLQFLQGHKVAVVDTSNICDYEMLDLQGGRSFHPRIIWTIPYDSHAQYFSYVHEDLSEEERKLMAFYFAKSAQSSGIQDKKGLLSVMEQFHFNLPTRDKKSSIAWSTISKKTIKNLERYYKDNVIDCNDQCYDFGDIGKKHSSELINNATEEQLTALKNHPAIQKFLPQLVESWKILNPEVYVFFMQLDGWNAAFKECERRNVLKFLCVATKIREGGFPQAAALIEKLQQERRLEDILVFFPSKKSGTNHRK